MIKKTLIKGTVFWYRQKNKIYGCIVLDVQPCLDYLIAISEELESQPNTIDTILKSKLYTVAWFSAYDIISNNRIHIVGAMDIRYDYNGRAGFLLKDDKYINKNCGQAATWKHLFRSISFKDRNVESIVNPYSLPITRCP